MWKRRFAAPEKLLILVLLSLGLIACLAIPLSAGYDEETHFIRAWEMAHLYFIPNEQLGAKLPFPALYWELSYRRQPLVEAVAPGFWAKYAGLPMDAHDYVYANVETRSVYSPILLLPQALTLRYLGLSLGLPALSVYYACRLVGLLSYLILCWLAVRLIPYGKWLLAILAVSPMALFQASTISADTISNGIGFLFLGASLAIANNGQLENSLLSLSKILPALRSSVCSAGRGIVPPAPLPQAHASVARQAQRMDEVEEVVDRRNPAQRDNLHAAQTGILETSSTPDISWKSWFTLLGLIALLFVAKVNLIFLALLPFLLIPPSRFKMRFGYLLLAAAAIVLLLIEVGGWNVLAYSKFTRALEGASPAGQLHFILSNPLLFVKIIAADVWTDTPAYVQGWVGVYGYNYWPVPALVYVLYPLAVLTAIFRGDPLGEAVAQGGVRASEPQASIAHSGPKADRSQLPLRTPTPRGVGGTMKEGRELGRPIDIPDNRTRILLASLFVLGYLLTIASLYLAFIPVGSLFVAGVQGRYFTVIMPLLFLALLGLRPWFGRRGGSETRPSHAVSAVPTYIPALLAASALLLYMLGLLLSYQVPCGSEYYRWSLCYQPQYKNWAPESVSSAPISPSLTLIQEIVPACNGMTELSLWVNSNGADLGGMTQLMLRAPTQQKDLVQQTFTTADLPKDGWLTVRFSPEWRSENQLYLLRLTGSSAGGIQVGYSEKPEYLRGKLFENVAPIGQDILFQYGCIAGLQKWFGTVK